MWSNYWWFRSRPRKPSCKDFIVSIVPHSIYNHGSNNKNEKVNDHLKKEKVKGDLTKDSVRKNDCCFDINITNNYSGPGLYRPTSFKVIARNSIITSASAPLSGWNKTPAAVPPSTAHIVWNKATETIPTGVTNLGNICFGSVTSDPFYVVYEFYTGRDKPVCRDSIKLSCGKEERGCNEFGLRLLNKVANTFKKIRIVPLQVSNVTGVKMDEDIDIDWSLSTDATTAGTGTFYEFEWIATGGYIPADPANLLDVNFVIHVDQTVTNPKVNVFWIDATGIVKKSEQITLAGLTASQLADEDYLYNWENNTTQISGIYTDQQVFAGAEAQQCSGNRSPEAECTIGYQILPCQDNQLSITVQCNGCPTGPGTITYEWYVGSAGPFSGSSFSTQLTGTNHTHVPITLKVHGVEPQVITPAITLSDGTIVPEEIIPEHPVIVCEKEISVEYCRPTAEFLPAPIVVACDGTPPVVVGWDVDFTSVTDCSNITSYTWDFGDLTGNGSLQQGQASGSGQISTPKYRYPPQAGTYDATLTLTDDMGCTDVRHQSVVITADCSPKFHINYEWCDDSLNLEQRYPVKVIFTNQTVSLCNSTYMWDYGDGTSDATGEHIYNTFPNHEYTAKLTMTDPGCSPNPISISHNFKLRPIQNGFHLTACTDGMVKWDNDCDTVRWQLPNWQLAVSDPTFYCLPCPFSPWTNLQINAFLGLFETSVPQIYLNSFTNNHFEFRCENGAIITSTSICRKTFGEFVTGTCTKTKTVTVNITCCIDGFRKVEYDDITLSGREYTVRKLLKVHYRSRHNPPAIGTCIDTYASMFGLPEATHLKASAWLLKKKTLWGMNFYAPRFADVIRAGVSGWFLMNGGPANCGCTTPIQWDANEQNSNFPLAKYTDNTPSLYRVDKSQGLHGYYYVQKGSGTDKTWYGNITKMPGLCAP